MRKILNQLKKIVKLTLLVGILAAVTVKVIFISVIPEHLYYFSVPIVIVALYLWMARGHSIHEKYHIKGGYVVLTRNNEFEHRHIAKRLLNRDLLHNEVVHHINGKPSDNLVRNLCVMDREKHNQFHKRLRRMRPYPTYTEQKRILVSEYKGILLEDVARQNAIFKLERRPTSGQRNLFNELKSERKRIAAEKNIPIWQVFNNATLGEMATQLPVTEKAMLEVPGVGPIKLQMYGNQFMTIIKRHKNQTTSTNRGTA